MPTISEIAAKIKEEKPFQYIVQNLESTFGEPKLSRKSDPLAMLIGIILSQATSDVNSHRTFRNLKAEFEDWDAVLAAETGEIADAIRLGGLANQKRKLLKICSVKSKKRTENCRSNSSKKCPTTRRVIF